MEGSGGHAWVVNTLREQGSGGEGVEGLSGGAMG